MPNGDITTNIVVTDHKIISAKMIAMESFVFCGEEYLPYCFPKPCKTKVIAKDGENVKYGDTLVHIDGPANQILTYERVILNLTQRLCGISTETFRYCNLRLPSGFKVMDTRKTTPGLRLFEKHAVSIGGGWNHRLDLSSSILIKDNHIQAAGSIKKTLHNLKKLNKRGVPIELEVDTIDQLKEGLNYDLDGFLIDNMKPEQVKKCVELIREKPNGETFFIEASGGINFETLESYAKTGVDGVSMSAITANASSVDIKLEFNND